MSPAPPKYGIRAICEIWVTLERENWALRKLLHTLGQSNASIQRKVVSYLKSEDYRQSAIQQMHKLCEETIKRLPVSDLEELLAEMPIKGPHQ
jgi:hypothetical protein